MFSAASPLISAAEIAYRSATKRERFEASARLVLFFVAIFEIVRDDAGVLAQPIRGKIMKTIALVLSLAVSGIAISAAYTSAQASRMNGKGGWCSSGTNCMQDRYYAATKKSMSKTKKPGM